VVEFFPTGSFNHIPLSFGRPVEAAKNKLPSWLKQELDDKKRKEQAAKGVF
jgi:hypothetical protein